MLERTAYAGIINYEDVDNVDVRSNESPMVGTSFRHQNLLLRTAETAHVP